MMVVMGLIGKQQRALEKKYPAAKFKFFEVSGRPRGGSHVFLMLKFLSHNHVQAVQKRYDSNQIIYVHGGFSRLCEAVDSTLGSRHSQVS